MDIPDLPQKLALWLILCASIALHEFGHAWMADRMGDRTPASQGRVTLNPLAHLDPIGTGVIPLFMILFNPGFALIGWGRPVQVDPSQLYPNRVRKDLLITGAGPFMNLVILAAMIPIGASVLVWGPENLHQMVGNVIFMNAALIVFNMLPIPPLDGSHFMRYAVGMKEETYMQFSRYGFIILIILINVPAFRQIFSTLIFTLAQPFFGATLRVAEFFARLSG